MGTLDSIYEQQRVQQVLNDWKITPATFAHRISRGSWIPADHLMYISARIARAIAKGNARIIVSAPPRHGKSELISVNTPAWVIERFAQKRIILAGYGADLATGFSRKVRDIFQDPANQELLTTRVRKDASRVEAFLTERGGGMYAVGLGGAITGRGADVLLIDDYIKEIKEALSPAYRDYVWNWFVTTAFTRLEPGGSCIIIATRWHSDDLIGRILRDLPDENWEYIEIPAIAEEGDLLGRNPGDPLFAERYPIERLLELKRTLGTIFFQALFQQKPVDESNKMTDSEWIRLIDEVPIQDRKNLKFMRIWDLAATPGGGDYTTGTLMAYSNVTQHTYIMNCIRKQISPGQIEMLVRQTAEADGYGVKVRIEQEPGSAGKNLVYHYKNNVLSGFNVEGVPVVVNKLIRAQPFMAAAEAGTIRMLRGPWNEPFLKEFDEFPGGENDDQVDTASAGYSELTGKKAFSATWGRKSTQAANNQQSSSANSKNARIAMGKYAVRGTRGATWGR